MYTKKLKEVLNMFNGFDAIVLLATESNLTSVSGIWEPYQTQVLVNHMANTSTNISIEYANQTQEDNDSLVVLDYELVDNDKLNATLYNDIPEPYLKSGEATRVILIGKDRNNNEL